MAEIQITLPYDEIVTFCRKWKITEFALFGSVLRPDFGPQSDIDVMITHTPDARWNLYDLVQMTDELQEMFNRKVDVLNRKGVEHLENAQLKKIILESAQVIHRAA